MASLGIREQLNGRYKSSVEPIDGPTAALKTAQLLLERFGIHCISYRTRTKRSTERGGQTLRLEGDELREAFSRDCNIGMLTGNASSTAQGELHDVDLDCDEALYIADLFLPPTALKWGRPYKPVGLRGPTHWGYRVRGECKKDDNRTTFFDPLLEPKHNAGATSTQHDAADKDRAIIAELRGSRHQSMCPPSIHPDGDELRWYALDGPAVVSIDELQRAVALLSSTVLLSRVWPGSGGRHDFGLMLAGALWHLGVSEDEATTIFSGITRLVPGEDACDRESCVTGTYNNATQGKAVTGIPTLKTHLDAVVVDRLVEWLASPDGDKNKDDGASEHDEGFLQALATVQQEIALFHTPAGEPYAAVPVNGHTEVLPIGTATFKEWFARWWYVTNHEVLGESTLAKLQTLLSGRARYDGPEAEVYTRVAYHDGKLYVNLANDDYQVVEIDPAGWRIMQDASVYFRRAKGLGALPTPVRGGSLNELRPLINIGSDENWQMAIGWLICCFHPTGPYMGFSSNGEEGSGKSSLTHRLCQLVDPSVANKRTTPKNEQDLAIAAKNKWILAMENVSSMPQWLSDALCRLSTGGALACRKLYTDDEESLLYAKRPFILNGILQVATNGDLLNRLLVVTLPAIAEEQRRPEHEIDDNFDACYPRLLGSLYDVLSAGLREWSAVHLEKLPRMADCAEWVVACEPALGWAAGTFVQTLFVNQEQSTSTQLETSVVARAVQRFMTARTKWSGLASVLNDELKGACADVAMNDPNFRRQWPKNASALGGELTRLARSLRQIGIEVTKQHTKHGTQWVLESKDAAESAPEREYVDPLFERPEDAVESVSSPQSPLASLLSVPPTRRALSFDDMMRDGY